MNLNFTPMTWRQAVQLYYAMVLAFNEGHLMWAALSDIDRQAYYRSAGMRLSYLDKEAKGDE